MIRALHIGLSTQFGGIESFLLNLSRSIDCGSFCFDYVAYSKNVPREDEFSAHGGRIYHLNGRRNWIRYASELSSIMARGYDVVHIHKNSAADVVPFLCARSIPGVKIVAHAHNTRSGGGAAASALSVLGRKVVLSCSDARLACSLAAGEWLYGDRSRIDEVVPNGIDLSAYAFDPAVRERVRGELGVGDDLVVGCVGRFKPEKNQAFLAGVLRELVRMGVGARVLFLGDGPEMDGVKRAFSDEGVSDRAIFLGSVPNVADYMQAMDVLAMPSLFEGLPLVAVEAQASGLGVVMSERVTEEACLTERVVRVPVDDGKGQAWARSIGAIASEARCAVSDSSRLKPFDSRNTATVVQRWYEELLGGRA